MTILRTHLIKAVYNWIIDHNQTPYLLVDTSKKNISVPEYYIDEDNKVLLNIGHFATKGLKFNNLCLEFNATFDREEILLQISTDAVLELYSSETREGFYANGPVCKININEGYGKEDTNYISMKEESKKKECKEKENNLGLYLV